MKSGGGGKSRLSSRDRSLGAKSWETYLAAFSYARGSPGTVSASTLSTIAAEPLPPELAPALAKLESYFTDPDQFGDVSRGKPIPHKLAAAKKKEVGLTRETWKLEVVSDPEHPATLGKQFTKKDGTALDFATLLKLGEKHAVRFAKVMTCLNIGCPLGMGIWEGVPLREVALADQAEGEPAPRLLLRLPQRRPEADVPQLAAGRPGARGLRRLAAGDRLLQAQRRVAEP